MNVCFSWGVRKDPDQPMFSVKDQIVNMFSFVIWEVFVVTKLICFCSVKAAIGDMQMNEVAVFQ